MEESIKTPKISSSDDKEWLDLQDAIVELIIERLPIRYYIRFGSVCRKWRDIQRAHRRHCGVSQSHSSCPWLIPQLSEHPIAYSPFDKTLHRLHLRPFPLQRCLATSRSWLLLITEHTHSSICHLKQPSLLNPIYGPAPTAQIQLPLLPSESSLHKFLGAMSAPPTDPQCTIFVKDKDRIFLCRVGERWTLLHLPQIESGPVFDSGIKTSVYFGGKFYCISRWFMVVDPVLPNPSMQVLEMGHSQFPDEPDDFFLVEVNGDLMLVVALFDHCYRVEGFQVFKADFTDMIWVRVEGVGNYALFLDESCAVSLLAADVGFKKNCIYYTLALAYGDPKEWEVFDLDTRTWIAGPEFPGGQVFGFYFLGFL